MSEAPERIWINGAMAMGVSGKGWPEYVHADLYEQQAKRIAELEVELVILHRFKRMYETLKLMHNTRPPEVTP